MGDQLSNTVTSIQSSQMLRLFYIGALVLILQIPIMMIGELINERQARRTEAVAEVSSKWGGSQTITGPALILPYSRPAALPLEGGNTSTRPELRHAVFLPERLDVQGMLNTESRSRGIFQVPVYRSDLSFEGEFARPDLNELGIDPSSAQWNNAYIAVGIADTRAIQQSTSLTWNGAAVPFVPGTRVFAAGVTGIHVPVVFAQSSDRIPFSFPLSLNGSMSLQFVPVGKNTNVSLSGNTGHPSFQGNWLPAERTVADNSFEARWSVPYLGRGFPQAWTAESDMREVINPSRFGVDLVGAVDDYRMAQRSVKYASLFILLTFATVWLIEILAGVRVHAIQYLMLGGALCLFYLLELSLSEHIGFPVAYAIAALAVVLMVGSYCMVALKKAGRAVGVASGVGALYVYLYVLLRNDDYALLAGSVGLFLILGAIMYATRNVDWYRVREA